LEERLQKVETYGVVNSNGPELSKNDKRKINELQSQVADIARWKAQAQEQIDAYRRAQIGEQEIDSRIKKWIFREYDPKLGKLEEKIRMIENEMEPDENLEGGIQDLKGELEKLRA